MCMNKYKKILSIVLIALMIFGVASCKTAITNGVSKTDSSNAESNGARTDPESSDSIVLENPHATILANLKISGQAIDLKVSGDYLYVTNDLGYLYVVDIKDKMNPEVIGKCAGIDAANIVFI
jgi:hypothetical protein